MMVNLRNRLKSKAYKSLEVTRGNRITRRGEKERFKTGRMLVYGATRFKEFHQPEFDKQGNPILIHHLVKCK